MISRAYARLRDQTPVTMRPGVFRRTLAWHEDQMIAHFTLEAGSEIPLHTHVAVQTGYVVSGCIRFFREDGSYQEMSAGDGYVFGSMEPHGSRVLEDTILVECFSPVRPEYLPEET